MKFVLASLIILFALNVFANSKCENVLAGNSFYQTKASLETSSPLELTERFVAYLKDLHLAGIISVSNLEALSAELKEEASEFKFLEIDNAQGGFKLVPHRQQLGKYLANSSLDRSAVVAEIDRLLDKIKDNTVERNAVESETADYFREMEFANVQLKPTKFIIKSGWMRTLKSKLKHSIAIGTTAVTQAQWVEIMGENPHNVESHPEAISVDVNGKEVWLLLDHPVVMVTVWSMMEFANRLSIRDGLEPAYALNYNKLNGRAEGGRLQTTGNTLGESKASHYVKFNSRGGNLYKTQGYRLPSFAERLFFLTGGNQWATPKDLLLKGEQAGSEPFMAWAGMDLANPGEVHEVEALAEDYVTEQGKKIYGLLGNINEAVTRHSMAARGHKLAEMGWSAYDIHNRRRSATDDRSTQPMLVNVLRGLNWLTPKFGFRLVRTLSKEEAKQ